MVISTLINIDAFSTPVDFLFTDIVMPHLSGIDLAKTVNHKVKNIILVSGHLEYALDGYDVHAKHFLPKPFNFTKFEGMIKKLCQEENSNIYIKSGKTDVELVLQDIIAFEAALNYVHIHTIKKLYVCYFPLKEVEAMLPPNNNFVQINRSYIINKDQVEKIKGDTVYLKNSIVVKCGSTFKLKFKMLLKDFKKF